MILKWKFPESTPNTAILAEIGERPVNIIIEERQLNFLWDLMNFKNRCNDIFKIQLEQTSKTSIVNHLSSLLKKYNIQLSLEQIKKLPKYKWKKITRTSTWNRANQWYKDEADRLSKLKLFKKYKSSISQKNILQNCQDQKPQSFLKVELEC